MSANRDLLPKALSVKASHRLVNQLKLTKKSSSPGGELPCEKVEDAHRIA